MLRAMAGSCTARPPLKYRCVRRKRIPRCHATGGSFEFGAAARDFDKPLSARHVEVQSGGSRSAGTSVYVDLGLYAHDAANDAVQWAADGLLEDLRVMESGAAEFRGDRHSYVPDAYGSTDPALVRPERPGNHRPNLAPRRSSCRGPTCK
jgi:hypothetical protein